ncbi:MAG: sulfatase family protein [Gemmatimonadales bacterium]
MKWSPERAPLLFAVAWCAAATGVPVQSQQRPAPRNVVFILSDDHRHDFMGFMPGAPEWLETPNFDRMALRGAHLRNAFVTTSLCSPSRASILTGKYAHKHGVVDNTTPVPSNTTFFPQLLQKAGYRTAYIGKWHMGEATASDDPRPGFDHWISFQGQGVYVDPVLNVNGKRARVKGYTTDLLTDSALGWLEHRSRDQPFFLYLSHKGVHAEFIPAERHRGRYAAESIPYPPTMANTERNYRDKPRWVREQRSGWHGVDYAYHGAMDFDSFYRRYAETLLAVDESVGRVLDYLERSKLAQSTLLIYMGDNGFSLGEHGLIDKRHAYEESIRVPMLAWAPGLIAPGTKLADLVRNIDVAPTILDLAGVARPGDMDGRSVLTALRGRPGLEPVELLYEYYWEYAFPHTPTVFALRDERYKYIYYHGIWDLNEFYDLKTDSLEQHNLIEVPAYQERIRAMRSRLFDRLQATDGMQIPLRRGDWQAAERKDRE